MKKFSKAEKEDTRRSNNNSSGHDHTKRSNVIDLAHNSDCSDSKSFGGKRDRMALKKKEQVGKVPPVVDGKGVKKSSKAATFFLSKVV